MCSLCTTYCHENFRANRATFSCCVSQKIFTMCSPPVYTLLLSLSWIFMWKNKTVIYCYHICHVLIQTYHCLIVSTLCDLVYTSICLPKSGDTIFWPFPIYECTAHYHIRAECVYMFPFHIVGAFVYKYAPPEVLFVVCLFLFISVLTKLGYCWSSSQLFPW